jgi:hypothetical protein
MAQEMIEKSRSNTSTPRATQPVLARMPPRSIKRTAANTKMALSPQFFRIFWAFSTVAHENDGIKEKWRKSVVVLTALLTAADTAHTLNYLSAAAEILRPG